MNDTTALDFTLKALTIALILSLPPVLTASFAGILLSLIQALTQIQEQTVQFAVRLIVVTFTLLFTLRWVGVELYNFGLNIFNTFPLLVR